MRPEDAVQKAIIEYLEAVVPRVFVFAIPNAARRVKGKRAGNAVPGLRAGMPDLCFLQDGAAYFVEVKTPKRPHSSAAQSKCHDELRFRGHEVAVVWNVELMREALALWGFRTREVIGA